MVTEKGPAVVSRVYVSQTGVWPVSKTKAIHKPKLNRREAFQAAASDLDATFVQGERSSGDQVHLEHGPWKVILDTYVVSTGQTTVTYTRAQAPYVARNDFTLRVTRRNIFTPLSANVRETRSTQRIRVGRRQRKRTCWDCEREWKRMVVPLEPGRPSEARQLLRTRR